MTHDATTWGTGMPWWAILLQAPAAGAVMLALISGDYVIATAKWVAFGESTEAVHSDGGSPLLGLILLPIILGLLSLIIGVPILVWAAVGTLVLLVVGLPLRVIPTAGAVWLRYAMPWVLGAVGALVVVAAWIVTPVPLAPPRSYTPSSLLFAVGLALTGFAVAHLWLPRLRRRDRAPRDRELAQAPA